jgi:hypothetical protein
MRGPSLRLSTSIASMSKGARISSISVGAHDCPSGISMGPVVVYKFTRIPLILRVTGSSLSIAGITFCHDFNLSAEDIVLKVDAAIANNEIQGKPQGDSRECRQSWWLALHRHHSASLSLTFSAQHILSRAHRIHSAPDAFKDSEQQRKREQTSSPNHEGFRQEHFAGFTEQLCCQLWIDQVQQ